MSVLLQVSDPHFGAELPPVVEALTALSSAQKPDVMVMSGDITQRARPWQFSAAGRFVERLAVPHNLVIPGNHDIPLVDVFTRVFRPYARHRRVFGTELEPLLDLPDLLAIGVKTTRRWRHIDGQVSSGQVERVAARLRAATPGQLRVVITHQPVDVPHASDEHDLLHGHARAARAWTQAGADLIMGGHIHLPYVRPLGLRFPDLERRSWCVQAGTATSWRVRPDAPNSINLLRYGEPARDHRCTVERWDYTLARSRFECVETWELELERP
ncbi:MAG: metallophosphoesterase family protein [Panacagrimonas sp.]